MELTPRAQEMYAVIKEYLEADVTQTDFCRTKQLPQSTFQYWLKRYRTDNDYSNEHKTSNRKEQNRFIPLEIAPSADSLPIHCEIERPNGTIIKLKCQKVSPDFLELIRIMNT
jgi:transposase-like protein